MDKSIDIRKFVEKIIIENQENNVFKLCVEYFCKGNKKLYKYYSLDSEFTWSNIDNDIVYMSNPLDFNDSFDCNLGVSADQVMQIIQLVYLQKLFPGVDYKLLKEVIVSDIKPDSFTDEKIDILMKNLEKFREYINTVYAELDGEKITNLQIFENLLKKENVAFLLENSDLEPHEVEQIESSFEMINNYIKDKSENDKYLFISRYLEIVSENKNYIQHIDKLGKLLGQGVDKNLTEYIYSPIDEMQEQYRLRYSEAIGVSCFSDTCNNTLMWGLYANKNKGICVEYDISKLNTSLYNLFLFPVKYVSERPLIPLNVMYEYKNKLDDIRYSGEIASYFIDAFFCKEKSWSYENEWRLLAAGIKDSCRKIYFPCISKIITGVNISDVDYQKISQIADKKGIAIERKRLKRDDYKLE